MMWTSILRGPKDLGNYTMGRPEVNADLDVLIRVLYCGICGSDISKYYGINPRSDCILGHEFCGIVEKGPEELIGKLVTAIPLWYCGVCESCKEHRYECCSNHQFLGSTIAGAMREYITVPRRYVMDCELLRDNECLAALVEPLAVAVHAVRSVEAPIKHNIAIVGDGAIGTLLYEVLKNLTVVPDQAITVFGAEDEPIGNTHTLCFECSGTPDGFDKAIATVKPGGTIVQVGILYPKLFSDIPVQLDSLMRKEITLQTCWNSNFNSDWQIALNLLAATPRKFLKLIDIRSRDEITEAFESKPRVGVKRMIRIENRKKVVAIDFDGTITEDSPYPITGAIRPEAIDVIRKLQTRYICCLWTCRTGDDLLEAIELLAAHNIMLDCVNTSPYTKQGSSKILADYYIDDKNFGTTIDWNMIEKTLLGDDKSE